MQLQSGQNIPLTSSSITLNLRYPVRPAFRGEPDTCVFMLNAQGKVSGDNDFIFFNNLSSPDGAVKLTPGTQQSSVHIERGLTLSGTKTHVKQLWLRKTKGSGEDPLVC
ncbi:TerD family protein [Enterobacter asburiae]|uniref:TerD family protein n=1 Tax=Enterobacter asburiae TaxID=61645 RepID=UPI00123B8CC5